jgi:ribonuclease J
MKVCIHRGAKEIGGTCIEIESQGKRLVLDIGQPLDCPDPETAIMPAVKGFQEADPSLLGVILSHPHQDHYGLAHRLPESTRFLMGAAAERILKASADFTPSGGTFQHVTHLNNNTPIKLGPFTITPYLVDHSAYDSYAVLIEANGKRLFYTGDLRGHGRKSKLFTELVKLPPANVDVLLMEGTTLQRESTEKGFPTEKELELELAQLFKETKGMPLVCCSGQNIDRIVTVFNATKRSGRHFIVDMYTAHILDATENSNVPQSYWKEVNVFLPYSQKKRILQDKSFSIAEKFKCDRIYPENLVSVASRSVMLFRPSMSRDLEKANCLDGACLVYSMWDGYLKEEKMKPFRKWLEQRNIPLLKCHTSGHASVSDLRRLRNAFGSAVAVPVHCAEPELFATTFDRVRVHPDNEWWEVI